MLRPRLQSGACARPLNFTVIRGDAVPSGKVVKVIGAVGSTLCVAGVASVILREYMQIRDGNVVTAIPTFARLVIIFFILALAGWQFWRRSRLKRNS